MSATDLAPGAMTLAPDTRTVPRARAGGIALVLHDLRGGGAERACLRLAGGMVAAGRAVDLVLVKGEGAYLKDVPAGVNLTPTCDFKITIMQRLVKEHGREKDGHGRDHSRSGQLLHPRDILTS